MLTVFKKYLKKYVTYIIHTQLPIKIFPIPRTQPKPNPKEESPHTSTSSSNRITRERDFHIGGLATQLTLIRRDDVDSRTRRMSRSVTIAIERAGEEIAPTLAYPADLRSLFRGSIKDLYVCARDL